MINEMYVDSTKEFNGFDTLDLAIIRKYISPCLNAMANIKDVLYNNKFVHETIKTINGNDKTKKWYQLFIHMEIIEATLFSFRMTEYIKPLSKKVLNEIKKLRLSLLIFKLPILNRYMYDFVKNRLIAFQNKILDFLYPKYDDAEFSLKINQGAEDYDMFFKMFKDAL